MIYLIHMELWMQLCKFQDIDRYSNIQTSPRLAFKIQSEKKTDLVALSCGGDS